MVAKPPMSRLMVDVCFIEERNKYVDIQERHQGLALTHHHGESPPFPGSLAALLAVAGGEERHDGGGRRASELVRGPSLPAPRGSCRQCSCAMPPAPSRLEAHLRRYPELSSSG